ncbi:MAG: SIMPL domain-containing protein [Phycisphaerales bacterium]|nr:SIMPL domain-containing protein [Phycisphaerales bacterium]
MEHRIKVQALGPAIVVAISVVLSLVVSTIVVAKAWQDQPQAKVSAYRDITVKGKAVRKVESDHVTWSIGLQGQGGTLPEAYDLLEASIRRVKKFLMSQSLQAEEWAEHPIKTAVHYGRDKKGKLTQDITGYTLSQELVVSTDRVQIVQGAAAAVTTLIRDGIRVVSGNPEYTAMGLAEIKTAILAEATADARRRADLMVRQSGGVLGPAQSVRQGVIQVTRPHSTTVTSWGVYDTTTIQKEASVVVTAVFSVEAK